MRCSTASSPVEVSLLNFACVLSVLNLACSGLAYSASRRFVHHKFRHVGSRVRLFFSKACTAQTYPTLSSIRIGVTSFVLAFALLTGNPVAGALLTAERHWQRPLMFAAVSKFTDFLSSSALTTASYSVCRIRWCGMPFARMEMGRSSTREEYHMKAERASPARRETIEICPKCKLHTFKRDIIHSWASIVEWDVSFLLSRLSSIACFPDP